MALDPRTAPAVLYDSGAALYDHEIASTAAPVRLRTVKIAKDTQVSRGLLQPHRLTWFVLFAASGWVPGNASASSGASLEQLAFRVVPTLLAIGLVVMSGGLRGLASGLRTPLGLAVGVSSLAWIYLGRDAFAAWKTVEFVLLVAWYGLVRSSSSADAQKAFRAVGIFCALACCTTLAGIVIWPTQATAYGAAAGVPQVSSVYPIAGPGVVGLWASTALAVLVGRGRLKIPGRGILIPVSLVTLILSQSRGALVALVVGLTVTLWSQWRNRAFVYRLGLWCIGLTAGLATLAMWPNLLSRGDNQRLVTLSNRTIRWNEALEMIRANPLVGTGLGVAGRFADINVTGRRGVEGFGQTHNGYLDLTLALGVPVAGILIVWLLRTGKLAVRQLANPGPLRRPAVVAVIYLCAAIVDSFVLTYSSSMVVLLTAFAVLHHHRVDRQDSMLIRAESAVPTSSAARKLTREA